MKTQPKKLMRYNGVCTSFLMLFFCLFLMQCKKELVNPTHGEFDKQKQLIKEETINKVLDEIPISQLLTLDWKKSQQAIINGKKIVRIPLLHVNKIMEAKFSDELKLIGDIPKDKTMSVKGQANAGPSGTGEKNPNYFEQHPPELFFVQKENSNKVNAFLLNFVPTNVNSEFGENNIWTGTLYEWDLKGETLWVQEFIKSKLKDRYGLNKPSENNASSSQKPSANGKILSLGDKKVSNIFGWLVDLFGDVIGWLGGILGLPTTPNMNGYGPGGVRIVWSQIGNQVGIDHIAGDDVYGSYVPGASSGGGGGGFGPFPQDPNPSGGSAYVPASAVYLGQILDLGNSPSGREKLVFLSQNEPIAKFLADYLHANGLTLEHTEFVDWSLNYLRSDPSFNVNILGAKDQLLLIKNLNLNTSQKDFIKAHAAEAIILSDILKQDANLEENKIIAEAIVEELTDEINNTSSAAKSNDLISTIKNAISRSIIETAIITRKLYLKVNELARNNSRIISGINSKVINPIRSSLEVNLNPQTLEWRDLFNIWFFELGTFPISVESSPTIKIYQDANVITANSSVLGNALNNMPSVNDLRNNIRKSLKDNNVPIGHRLELRYNYNTNEYYGSLADQNTAKIFLGSFNTEVFVSAKSGNSATILFIVKNVSGWESATRFIKASGSTPTGIIDNKPRGTGLNIGGNFAQDIEWTETITW